jgi:hypothetical protein
LILTFPLIFSFTIEAMPFVLGASGEPVAFILSKLVLAFPLVFGFTIEPIPFVLGDFATPCALVFGNPGKPISFVRGHAILAFPLYGGRPIKFITLRLRRLVELLSFPCSVVPSGECGRISDPLCPFHIRSSEDICGRDEPERNYAERS